MIIPAPTPSVAPSPVVSPSSPCFCHWLPCCSWNTSTMLPPQDLCTGCSLYLGYSSLKSHMVLSLTSLRSLLTCYFIRWAFLATLFKKASHPFHTPILPVFLSYYIFLRRTLDLLSYYIFINFFYITHIHIHLNISSMRTSILFCHCLFYITNLKNTVWGASLVAQWLRICLPMQGTRVQALVWEDPTCRGATRPVSHNY